MNIPRALFFIDYANINRTANDNNMQLDYGHLRNYIGLNKELLDSYCYVPIDPRCEHKFDMDMEELQKAGYFLISKIGTFTKGSYKCNMDVEMAIDIIKMAHVVKPNIIILASGDGDFVPVICEIRKMGIRAEVAGFNSTMSRQLPLKASSIIDLDRYYKEHYAINGHQRKMVINEPKAVKAA